MKKIKLTFKKDKRTELEKEIDRLVFKMSLIEDQTSDEYKKYVDQLNALTGINVNSRSVKEVKAIDPNTILVVLGGLAEIVLIMSYENIHVLSTKAFNRILKPKI